MGRKLSNVPSKKKKKNKERKGEKRKEKERKSLVFLHSFVFLTQV